MAICMDYIKGGEVLIAPRLDYKYQYLLKCGECEECYCLLGPFISHCSSHYNRETSVEDKCPVGSTYSESNDDENHGEDVDDTPGTDGTQLQIEPIRYTKEEDPLTYTDQEYISDTEDLDIKYEIEREECNTSPHSMDYSPVDEPVEAEEITEDVEDTASENDEFDDDEDEEYECSSSSTSTFIEKFMATKENIIALIAAYKNQPKLWNNNLPTQIRKSPDRTKCLQQIATELQKNLNIQMTTQQISAIIVQLRHKYRVKLENEKVNGKHETNQKDALVFEHLSFLKPFLENNPLSVLDSHPNDIMPEQILQILDIYKRYPQLWNSDTMENCCKSKRAEALVLMKNDIETEMDLEVNENTLKKYLHCVHVYFSKQKRRDMGILKTKEPRYEYYDHMMFLYSYLGPFKCPLCRRLFQSPLQLKAHKHQHDGSLSLKCPQCKKGFKSVDPYIAHVRRHMNDLGVECKECGKGFLRTADLKIHMRAHTGAKPFFCDICGASFRHSQAFNVHRRRHVKQYSHNCPVCSKGCYTMTELKNHMRTHRDIREFACKICGKAFKTKKTMQQHTFIHEEGRNHMCPLCGKTFKNKIGLGHHLKTHGRNKALNSDFNFIFN